MSLGLASALILSRLLVEGGFEQRADAGDVGHQPRHLLLVLGVRLAVLLLEVGLLLPGLEVQQRRESPRQQGSNRGPGDERRAARAEDESGVHRVPRALIRPRGDERGVVPGLREGRQRVPQVRDALLEHHAAQEQERQADHGVGPRRFQAQVGFRHVAAGGRERDAEQQHHLSHEIRLVPLPDLGEVREFLHQRVDVQRVAGRGPVVAIGGGDDPAARRAARGARNRNALDEPRTREGTKRAFRDDRTTS
mmetsp:Transcript_7146/g.30451  ORF Transcript_7146/g.30451 Transcript_7146/m.30451 type:complete len:251 (+) Transcript_7146:110-862(+)